MYNVPNCKAATGEETDVYIFSQGECVKKAGPGVSVQIANNIKQRHDAAAKLTVGAWVTFAGQGDNEDDPLWLGRVMSISSWGGQGVRQNTTRRIHFYNNKQLKIYKQEVATCVMWYEAIGISSDALEYQISREHTTPVVTSDYSFIPISFDMHRILRQSHPVSKIRVSTRPGTGGNTSHQTTADCWLSKEFCLRWKMDKALRDNALSCCSEWKQN